MPVRPVALLALSVLLATAADAGPVLPQARQLADPPAVCTSVRSACGLLFDDFAYAGADDPTLAAHGWTVREGSGGPGVGARWATSNVTFPVVEGRSVLRLTLRTDGTVAGTSQAEIGRVAEDLQFGTFAARVRFTDEPVSGPGGDHLVQSFFAMSALPDCHPDYSEIDVSEYLPNGGYGAPGPLNTQTTWASTGPGCDDSVEADQFASAAGWHLLVATVTSDAVHYSIDGRTVAQAAAEYVPRHPMAIAFNHWLLDLDTAGDDRPLASTSVWVQDVDFVLAAPDRVLTAQRVATEVERLRASGAAFSDSR